MNNFYTKYNSQSKTPQRGSNVFISPNIQPKLTINAPNDVYEQEADAVADKVMRMEIPSPQTKTENNFFFKPGPIAISSVQRKCAHCDEEERKMQRKEMEKEGAAAGEGLENYVGTLSSGGQPLPNEVRNFYEPRFGYDFSSVKVHTDTVAAKSAQSINALAYTSGNNIVFNNGQYAPNTDSGKRLLGHELTHVVQQGKGLIARKEAAAEERNLTATGNFFDRPAEASAYIPPWLTSYNFLQEQRALVQRKINTQLINKKTAGDGFIIQRVSGGVCPSTCEAGTAPPYSLVSDPSFNCYAYAMNSPASGFLQPGQSANTFEYQIVTRAIPPSTPAEIAAVDHYFSPDGVLQNVNADLSGNAFSGCDGCCAPGKRKIIAVTTQRLSALPSIDNWDFHWYRKDADKGWSHKPGSTDSRRHDAAGAGPICNPCSSSRNFGSLNYVNVVGAWCV